LLNTERRYKGLITKVAKPGKMTKKVKTSISINPNYLEVADELARREDRSRSYILDRIIEVGLAAAMAEGIENFSEAMGRFRKNINEKGQELKRRARQIKENPPQ
jgi:hypothetical protein